MDKKLIGQNTSTCLKCGEPIKEGSLCPAIHQVTISNSNHRNLIDTDICPEPKLVEHRASTSFTLDIRSQTGVIENARNAGREESGVHGESGKRVSGEVSAVRGRVRSGQGDVSSSNEQDQRGRDSAGGSSSRSPSGTGVSADSGDVHSGRESVRHIRTGESGGTSHVMYFELFHGRKYPEEQLDDWGPEGPAFLVESVHVTYGGPPRILLEGAEDWTDLCMVDDMIYYDGMYYGDWSVFPRSHMDAEKRLAIFDEGLARP
jgi:hypothetical protein